MMICEIRKVQKFTIKLFIRYMSRRGTKRLDVQSKTCSHSALGLKIHKIQNRS